MPETLSPFVYWAQTEENVTLKVDLKDVKDAEVSLEPERLRFSAHGQGARGPHRYQFSLDLHSAVDPDASSYKVADSRVDLVLRKAAGGWWPRLVCQPLKPAWLKVDFDRWRTEDDTAAAVAAADEVARDVRRDYPGLYERVLREERGYRREDLRHVYLTVYNLCQLVGFVYVASVMLVRWTRDGPHSMPGTYDAVGGALRFLQLLQWLEVMHPVFGYTRGAALPPLMQNAGRSMVLFCMIEAEPRMQTKPVVFYLFLVWTAVELVRYPYYLTQLFRRHLALLTWLRYTAWIPLYPLGFLCEGIIILRNIPYFQETHRFSVALPNAWNFSFHFPTFLRLYLLLMILPAMYTLMSHMYRARVSKLGPRAWRRK